MQSFVKLNVFRKMTVIPAPLASSRPIPTDGTGEKIPGVPNGLANLTPTPGFYSVFESFAPQYTTDRGVPTSVMVLPCRSGGSGTYTLIVYGWRLIGSRWHNVVLFSGSCDCSIEEADTNATPDSIQNNDYVASAITLTSGIGATQAQVIADGTNPATVIVLTQGCAYLTFEAVSDTAAYVAVAPVS